MTTPMLLDSGHSRSSTSLEMVMEPIVQVDQAFHIIDSIKRNPTWNKHQCDRIAERFHAMADRFKSMGWSSNGGKASDGGPTFDELLKIVKKGAALISDYAEGLTSTVVSHTVNQDAFQELHEELDSVEESLGFQDLKEGFKLLPGMDLDMLKRDAEADKKEMFGISSQMQTTDMEHSQDLAKVVSEKTSTEVNVEKLLQVNPDWRKHAKACSLLPSFLKIDRKSQIKIDKVQRVREYVPQSKRDPKGQSGWASVKSGKWLGCDFAIKVFKCGSPQMRAEWNESQLLMEVGKLVELQHPHVVRLVGFGEDDEEEECVFVMELMDGDLRQYIAKRAELGKTSKESEDLGIIKQIAKGMYFMHTKGYAHGDLKCSNVLVKKLGEYLEVKISDLRGSQSLDKVWDPIAFKQASLTRRPRWTAPEAIDHYDWVQPCKELLKKSDVYSFGMTCYEIVTGKYPFDGVRDEEELLRRINDGAAKHNPFPPGLDEGLKGLITLCWSTDPNERPSFESICCVLDTIKYKSKKLEDVKNKCRLVIAAAMSTVKRVFTGVGSVVVKGNGKVPELLRSNSLISAPEYLSIHPDQLKRGEPIEMGAWGEVFKATWLGCTFAVKILRYFALTGDLQQEVEFLIRVSRHPCIVQMVGLSNSGGEHSIVLEYMAGSLRQLIATRLEDKRRESRPFNFREEVFIITKIALGMAYLHSRGLVHRDLSSGNVLAQDYTGIVDVKIVDFGRSYLEGFSKSGERYYEGVGSGFYRAPEMLPLQLPTKEMPEYFEVLPALLPGKCTCIKPELEKCKCLKPDLDALKATDVYSFAMLCYEILSGDRPFSYLQRGQYAKVREGHRPKWPLDPRPELKPLIDLIEQCWSMDPMERPTFIDICTKLESEMFSTTSRLNRI